MKRYYKNKTTGQKICFQNGNVTDQQGNEAAFNEPEFEEITEQEFSEAAKPKKEIKVDMTAKQAESLKHNKSLKEVKVKPSHAKPPHKEVAKSKGKK